MRIVRRSGFLFVLLGMVAAGAPAVGQAQFCGDPDGSGSITVSDGVNVLRYAADLSGTCDADPNRCDVDDSGAVTVTDGVNVLRGAAGLDATIQCRIPDGSRPASVARDVSMRPSR